VANVKNLERHVVDPFPSLAHVGRPFSSARVPLVGAARSRRRATRVEARSEGGARNARA
jgi:hypothetical protein